LTILKISKKKLFTFLFELTIPHVLEQFMRTDFNDHDSMILDNHDSDTDGASDSGHSGVISRRSVFGEDVGSEYNLSERIQYLWKIQNLDAVFYIMKF